MRATSEIIQKWAVDSRQAALPTSLWKTHGLINTWAIYVTEWFSAPDGTCFNGNKMAASKTTKWEIKQTISWNGFLQQVFSKWRRPLLTQKKFSLAQATLKGCLNKNWETCFNIKLLHQLKTTKTAIYLAYIYICEYIYIYM